MISLTKVLLDCRASPNPIPVILVNSGCAKGDDGSAEDEDSRQAAATCFHDRSPVVLNVLRHGKPKPSHCRINNPIDDAVKLILFERRR